MIRKVLDYRCDPFLFGLYRIALGLFLLVYFLLLSNCWIDLYGPDGFSPIKLRHEITFVRPSVLSYLHSNSSLWIFFGVLILMNIMFILGRWKKLPAVFLWLTLVSIQNSNSRNVNAEEFALCVFIFYAVIMPINATLKWDWKKRHFSDSFDLVPAWTLIPFFVHIELIYVISLPLKPYFDPAWIDGTLIYYAVNTYDMSRFPGLEIFKSGHAILSRVMTWASLVVEAVFPVMVWTRRYRVLSTVSMIGFQIGIAALLSGVQVFSLSMVVALILFLPGPETHQLYLVLKNSGARAFFVQFWPYLFGRVSGLDSRLSPSGSLHHS